jgi:hypothetical protein
MDTEKTIVGLTLLAAEGWFLLLVAAMAAFVGTSLISMVAA